MKISTTIYIENRTYAGNTRKKHAVLIWNWGKTKYKLAAILN